MMHGTMNLKFIDARQAKEIYQYKNIQNKLRRTTAAIWYNKLCRNTNLTPNYVHIKVNGDNKQSRNTLKMAEKFCLNQEIKFLYL
jgi:hypothetical protein